ncbi:DegV family protein with EDD domain [Motilibacter peucedani]|uniref:DegV family protein with EDD domain n=1 Tax=Motilibacter peucedani TaxID=598650 RepID=A0A420XNX3_9ACTN|nr:DegV family protein with EDD domain [Motilibacter peucedani]
MVTDSTACLPAARAAAAGVTVVPLRVVLGPREGAEDEIAPAEVAEALRRRVRVTTSAPSPRALRAAYAAAMSAGATGVVSVHLSTSWSGTLAAAQSAAAEAPLPVTVVDAGTLAGPLAWAALDAAAAATAGGSLDEVAAAAGRSAERSSMWFLVPTLEHLRRGGRIRTGSALLGTALAVKPILRVHGGALETVDRVRTLARALDRLVEVTSGPVAGSSRVTVHHLGDADRAAELVARLAPLTAATVEVVEVGAVIGAHVGPGVLAVAVDGVAP